MHLLLIIIDGAPDRPLKELHGRTPLEEADTQNMDEIAKSGICGIMYPIAPGIRPGSDVAHLAILGYDPFTYYTGRGAFEAAGCGIQLNPSDVALRCNFATVNDEFRIVDRRAGREDYGLEDVASAINGIKLSCDPEVEVIFKRTTGHRAVLILRGKELSPNVSDIDPGKVGVKPLISNPLEPSFEAKKTSAILNEFVKRSHEILKVHRINKARVEKGFLPANIVLTRGAGTPPRMETLKEKYNIDSSACIAEVALVKGVAVYAGMKLIDAPGSTAGLDTDTEAMGRVALKALEENEFVLLSIKGPDVASHDGNLEGKIKIIEKIDKMVGLIWDNIDRDNTILVLTSDHSTPICMRDHSGDPVPVCIAGPGVRTDDVDKFNERASAKGGLGRIKAIDLMPILLDLMGKARKIGA